MTEYGEADVEEGKVICEVEQDVKHYDSLRASSQYGVIVCGEQRT